jgi:BON domain
MNLLKQTTVFLVVTLVLGTAGCSKSSSDAEITGRVKTAISKEPELKGTKVSVSTNEKVVHLGGTVKSRTERATLIAVARKVEGVKGVKTDLAVAPQQSAGIKPQQKPRVEARAKREPQAQVRAKAPGAGVPPER